MNAVIQRVKTLIVEHKAFFLYGLISVFVTVIDMIVSRFFEGFFGVFITSVSAIPVTANTVGVVVGFIIQYFLTAKYVYHTRTVKSFSVFLGTFFINLFFASTVIFVFRTLLFDNSLSTEAFLVSKIASIVIPFFVTYFIRKKVMPKG